MSLRKWNSKVNVQMLGNMLLFFVFVALPVAQGLYFHIAETERKCFIEEIPDETMVIGKLAQKSEIVNETVRDIDIFPINDH